MSNPNLYTPQKDTLGRSNIDYTSDRNTQITASSTTALSSFVSQIDPTLSKLQQTTAQSSQLDARENKQRTDYLANKIDVNAPQGSSVDGFVINANVLNAKGVTLGRNAANQAISEINNNFISDTASRQEALQQVLDNGLVNTIGDADPLLKSGYINAFQKTVGNMSNAWLDRAAKENTVIQHEGIRASVLLGLDNPDKEQGKLEVQEAINIAMHTSGIDHADIFKDLSASVSDYVLRTGDRSAYDYLQDPAIVSDPRLHVEAQNMIDKTDSVLYQKAERQRTQTQYQRNEDQRNGKINILDAVTNGNEVTADMITDPALHAYYKSLLRDSEEALTPEAYGHSIQKINTLKDTIFTKSLHEAVSPNQVIDMVLATTGIDPKSKKTVIANAEKYAKGSEIYRSPETKEYKHAFMERLSAGIAGDHGGDLIGTSKLNYYRRFERLFDNTLKDKISSYIETHDTIPSGQQLQNILEATKDEATSALDYYLKQSATRRTSPAINTAPAPLGSSEANPVTLDTIAQVSDLPENTFYRIGDIVSRVPTAAEREDVRVAQETRVEQEALAQRQLTEAQTKARETINLLDEYGDSDAREDILIKDFLRNIKERDGQQRQP